MRDLAEHGSWRDLIIIDLAIIVLLIVAGFIGDGPLIGSTAALGAPIAFAVTAVGFALIRRRYASQ